jgi:hypothetical protein
MAEEFYTGYADEDALAHRGWVLGHFMSVGDPRQSEDVEIKWAAHSRGDKRVQWGDHGVAYGGNLLGQRPVPRRPARSERRA